MNSLEVPLFGLRLTRVFCGQEGNSPHISESRGLGSTLIQPSHLNRYNPLYFSSAPYKAYCRGRHPGPNPSSTSEVGKLVQAQCTHPRNGNKIQSLDVCCKWDVRWTTFRTATYGRYWINVSVYFLFMFPWPLSLGPRSCKDYRSLSIIENGIPFF